MPVSNNGYLIAMVKTLTLAQLVPFLRHRCYVHSPLLIYTRPHPANIAWLRAAARSDAQFSSAPARPPQRNPQLVSLPAYVHNALVSLDCDWRPDLPILTNVVANLQTNKNRLEWTGQNIELYARETGCSVYDIKSAYIEYMSSVEVNGSQPVTDDELRALRSIGVGDQVLRLFSLLTVYKSDEIDIMTK